MAVLAHPDDESFLVAGTLAMYARLGIETALVCATRGEAGKAGNPPLCSREELGAYREGELREACRVIGIHNLCFLGYRDKELEQADPCEAVGRITGTFDRYRPQVVITFPPDGLSGHPDHVAISALTTRACHEVWGRVSGGRASDDSWRPTKLFYAGAPHRGIVSGGGKNPARLVTVNIAGSVDTKIAALRCHRTQHQSIGRFFGDFSAPEVRQALSREYFYLEDERVSRDGVRAEAGEMPENDLFAGVD